MRHVNGTFARNRLPAEATNTAAAVGKSIGGAAVQAVLIVTAVRLVDAMFTAVMDRRQTRRGQPNPRQEKVAT